MISLFNIPLENYFFTNFSPGRKMKANLLQWFWTCHEKNIIFFRRFGHLDCGKHKKHLKMSYFKNNESVQL
jgi:hypothetical protein